MQWCVYRKSRDDNGGSSENQSRDDVGMCIHIACTYICVSNVVLNLIFVLRVKMHIAKKNIRVVFPEFNFGIEGL